MKASGSNKTLSVGDLTGALGKNAPYDWAEEWDNVGLLIGDAADSVKEAIVSINLGPEALRAAQEKNANVIICHHPPVFKPLLKILKSSAPYLYEAIVSKINIITLHTNFDLASEQISSHVANALGFQIIDFLKKREGEMPASLRQGKFITYVPEQALDKVRQAVCDAGAGKIGDYSQCSFSWDGEGTFLGGNPANPTIGKVGVLEKVKEKRLEVIFRWNALERIVQAARKAHPYEEMAYDVVKLAQPYHNIGYGFVGDIKAEFKPTNFVFHKLADRVRSLFQLSQLTVVGRGLDEKTLKVSRIAFSPGSGSAFIKAAIAKGVDVYICGEVGYHQMLEARSAGLTLILLGHSYSERFFLETISNWCDLLGCQTHKVFEKIHDTA